jgi:hypothetical protein
MGMPMEALLVTERTLWHSNVKVLLIAGWYRSMKADVDDGV